MDPELSERIVARRLRAQRLTGALCATPEEAVGRLLGVQAQDYGPATWAVGARVAGATEASVEEAFDAGRILRTHVLRPTWHFVLPADLRWLLTATAPRIRVRDARRYAELGLDEATLRRAHEVVTAALRGGHALTRAELAAELAGSGVSPEGQRLPYLLMSAELDCAHLQRPAARQAAHVHAARRACAGGRVPAARRGARRACGALLRRPRPGDGQGPRLVGQPHAGGGARRHRARRRPPAARGGRRPRVLVRRRPGRGVRASSARMPRPPSAWSRATTRSSWVTRRPGGCSPVPDRRGSPPPRRSAAS